MDGTYIKDKAAWTAFKADQEKRCRWSSDAEPTHYPVVVVVHYDYDHRYAQNKLCFDFVYMDQFVDCIDRAHWHLYQLQPGSEFNLPFYAGEVFPNPQPNGSMVLLHKEGSAANHVDSPVLKFTKDGIELSGKNVKGEDTRFLLTQLRIPDHEVEWLE